MPRLAAFYGIVITMNFGDHDPPHFHARYGEHRAVITIDPLDLSRGRLPARAQSLVFEWATLRQRELMEAWNKASRLQPVERIDPLS